jgi:hypothetical protein
LLDLARRQPLPEDQKPVLLDVEGRLRFGIDVILVRVLGEGNLSDT